GAWRRSPYAQSSREPAPPGGSPAHPGGAPADPAGSRARPGGGTPAQPGGGLADPGEASAPSTRPAPSRGPTFRGDLHTRLAQLGDQAAAQNRQRPPPGGGRWEAALQRRGQPELRA